MCVYPLRIDPFVQQGAKLVGTGAAGYASQGASVALSSDGNTALVGGPANGNARAVWVFTRSGTTWTQQGPKLVGTGAVGDAAQGSSVALSSDGNTALVGGNEDNYDRDTTEPDQSDRHDRQQRRYVGIRRRSTPRVGRVTRP